MPYEADISAALQRLRNDVFAHGEYGNHLSRAGIEVSTVFEEGAKKAEELAKDVLLPEEVRNRYLDLARKLRESGETRKSKPSKREKTRTIQELLEQRGENGTHSILDIERISPTPHFGAISPLPRTELLKFFGTETPSRAEIDEVHKLGSLDDYISERWQGIYVIAYHEGIPVEILFVGCSGD